MISDTINIDFSKYDDEQKLHMKNMLTRIRDFEEKSNGKPHEWSLKDFEVGASLGRGRFGRVFLARDRHCHFKVAIKVLMKSQIKKSNVERQVLREIEIQSKLIHPNILKLYTFFHDVRKIYLVLEYAVLGELFGHLLRAKTFSEATSAKLIYQVADALHYCHLNKVIHRDLKPENILVAINGDVKLADFGWSVHAPSNRRKTMCGTVDYLPPEMVKRNEHSIFVDNWCLGILCYEFLVSAPPFESKNQDSTFKKIINGVYTFPHNIPSGAKDLISKLLKLTPRLRLTLPQVMLHPWIQTFKNYKVTPDKNGYIK